MLINNDVQSSQAAHRQRRIAADEKARVDRVVVDANVREGAVRQAGEAPTREEVAQFRGLMQAQGRDDRSLAGKQPDADARASVSAGDVPKFDGGLASLNTADRFRALLQRAFAPIDQQDEPVHGDRTTSPSSETLPNADRQDAASNPPRADDAQRAAKAEQQPPARGTQTPIARGDAAKPAADDVGSPNGKHGPEQKRKADSGDAETAQALARKAADGETQVGLAARAARSGDDSDENSETGMAQTGSGSTPTLVPTEAANAPTAPQRMADASQAQAAAASGNVAPALAELVQKHVKQMLVSDPRSARGRSREVLLRMQNDVLPGTDLWLTQTDEGWQLRADVRSRDAYDTLLANQDELVQRFADSALGKLSIEPVFHG